MRVANREEIACFRCALRNRGILRRSFLTALAVGSILVLINQGTLIFAGDFPAALGWKIPLTYLVLFLVTSWGALGNAWGRLADEDVAARAAER